MSDPRHHGDPLMTGVASVVEDIIKIGGLPLNKKNEHRAYFGAFILGTCGDIAVTLGPQASSYPDEWKLGFAGCALLGLVLFVTGIRGARVPRDTLGALFSLAWPIGGFVAVLNWAPELLRDFWEARAFCVGIACANIVRFWIAVRGPGNDAQKIVHQQIAQNEILWQPVKRRR